ILSMFMFLHNLFSIMLCVFGAGLFVNISLPALEGAYADYISETGRVEKEIEAVIDFFTNIGFIVGPMLAGILADLFGNATAFSLLGIIAAWLAFFLLRVTPKHINIRVSESLLANS
ncbi:MAG: MFS transporter, partial [Patescibacteria group bacterium]|nr:MFS transporter [Patescibacteria group bacterium]